MFPPAVRRAFLLGLLAALVPARGPAAAVPWLPGPPLPGRDTRPSAGKLLVAARQLADPNFSETVVLLVKHGPRGTMGLVLNRPTRVPLARVLPKLPPARTKARTVFLGGPVARNSLFLLLRVHAPPGGADPVCPGVALGTRLAVLDAVPAAPFRIYAGCASWAPGQLLAEIRRGDWYLLPARAADVFDPAPEHLWPRLIQRATTTWVLSRPAGPRPALLPLP
ncbi:hypothetical protein HCU62_09530 [Dissulfurirhabdus thermomarina]|nr:hypothetical protein [Dissulfurirhabdus thermomarina]